ncbi:hypothetical protein A3B19_02400 [Candidatus Giovannonibacteria bacterium RIFCSPLOWO2_01_FULL_46_32]|uniref:Phosphatidic acid phosphatase type 2/haloperoxidase domain-containing protein n=1 Tax=Candidatus Giovannonibacteria bacterium RIFCSPLOWO2_01_FULL_46_32 TaxID=1798353 RepID=A0A1F5XI56_9BACT|nr:MAG: hypothetical protein A3B19_02400 [Candidatus Giovannonibacteria bacterium RIFCSPLOWO2_01_FULL_46_32]
MIDLLIIFLAKYLGWVLGLGLAASLIRANGSTIMVIEAFLSGAVARFGITDLIRYFYNRPRPFESGDFIPLISRETGGSFPSGHAAFLFALAMTVFLYNRRWGALFFAGAILVGVGRVLAGLHWPSDILGGAAVGVLAALVVNLISKKLRSMK